MNKIINLKCRTLTIGFLLDSYYNEIGTEIWKNLVGLSCNKNINLICFTGGNLNSVFENNYQKNSVFELISKSNVDGIISLTSSIGNFVNSDKLTDYYKLLSGIPMISIGSKLIGVPSILIDNEKGMFNLIDHLIEKHNRKNIIFINGPEENDEAVERFEGYKKALIKHNIYLNEKFIIKGDFTRVSGLQAAKYLLKNRNIIFDAVVGANDSMIINAFKELNNHFSIPDKVLIAGFDNSPESQNIDPPLTTVSQPYRKIAEKSIEFIVKMIQGKKVPDSIKLSSELIIRKSCSCTSSNENNNSISCIEINNNINLFNKSDLWNQSLILHDIFESLISCYSMKELKKILRNNLYRLGINSYYINSYDKNYKDRKYSKLICFNKETDGSNLNDFSFHFQSKDIIPGGIKNINSKKSFIILALFINDNIFGYAVFEKGPIVETIYETLAIHISNTLIRILHKENIKINKYTEKNYLLKLINKKDSNVNILKKKYRNSSLTKEESKKYYNKLVYIMKNEKLFMDPDLNMYDLAERLSISYNHLSQIINENSYLNFNDFINSFRIERIKNKLLKFNKDNILEIAYGTGFNSKSAFYNVFKKHLSMTPKEYIKKMSNHT